MVIHPSSEVEIVVINASDVVISTTDENYNEYSSSDNVNGDVTLSVVCMCQRRTPRPTNRSTDKHTNTPTNIHVIQVVVTQIIQQINQHLNLHLV